MESSSLAQMPYLQFNGIGKSFPGVRALDDVSFGVREGSVHALIGENGAGKSTLLKILSGAQPPTDGALCLGGETRRFESAAEAIAAGVAVIYQELHLVPELSVAENLYLGHLPARLGLVRQRRLRELAREQLDFMGERIDPRIKVGRLPIAQRQMVEIAKALTHGAKIIAFDEPTSSLSDREVRQLFSIIRELRARGCAIIYVSHRLDEIFEICDAVTVFRDGRRVETFESMKGVDHDLLVNRMVGRDIADIYHYEPRPLGDTVMRVDEIYGPGLSEPASFDLAKGEILGFFGLVGAGRSELLRLLFGATRKSSGVLLLDGEELDVRRPADAIRRGLMFCPEDRKKDGIIPVRSVMENVNLSARPNHVRGGLFLRGAWERANAAAQVQALNVKTPSLKQQIVNLSGGNQQKVILGRWLSCNIKVILLDEPTRGIDVGAKSEIYHIIYDLARQGVGVVLVSSDLPEILGVCDRIAVMREGQISAVVPRAAATEQSLLKAALPVG